MNSISVTNVPGSPPAAAAPGLTLYSTQQTGKKKTEKITICVGAVERKVFVGITPPTYSIVYSHHV